jgi:hypothetical protein
MIEMNQRAVERVFELFFDVVEVGDGVAVFDAAGAADDSGSWSMASSSVVLPVPALPVRARLRMSAVVYFGMFVHSSQARSGGA